MKFRNKKTGEILTNAGDKLILSSYAENGMSIRERYEYRTLSELCEDWEDYAPKRPLIKDEKIRKAVRAWAEVNSVEEALYAERPNRSLCVLEDMGEDGYSIDLVGWIPTLKDGEVYTIAELCGEKE